MNKAQEEKFRDLISSLLVRMFDKSTPEHDKHMSLKDAAKRLEKNGKDIYYVIGLFKNGFTEEAVQQAIQTAIDKGYQARVDEEGPRSAAKSKPPPADANGFNGHSWKQIVGHLQRHSSALETDYDRKYVKQVAKRFAARGDVTAEQARRLQHILIERFGGKI